MTQPRERKRFFNYATVTSTVALVLSLSSFYFTWLYEKHSLSVGIVSAGPEDVALPFTFTSDVIVLNRGNRTETLLAAWLSCDPPSRGSVNLHSPEQRKGPQVLKAGDAVPLRLELNINRVSLENCGDWTGPKHEMTAIANFALRISAVSPDGNEINKTMAAGSISYYEASGEVRFNRDRASNISLVEVLR